MRFLGIMLGMTLILALVAFAAITVVDVPFEQKQVVKTVSNERFYNNKEKSTP